MTNAERDICFGEAIFGWENSSESIRVRAKHASSSFYQIVGITIIGSPPYSAWMWKCLFQFSHALGLCSDPDELRENMESLPHSTQCILGGFSRADCCKELVGLGGMVEGFLPMIYRHHRGVTVLGRWARYTWRVVASGCAPVPCTAWRWWHKWRSGLFIISPYRWIFVSFRLPQGGRRREEDEILAFQRNRRRSIRWRMWNR